MSVPCFDDVCKVMTRRFQEILSKAMVLVSYKTA